MGREELRDVLLYTVLHIGREGGQASVDEVRTHQHRTDLHAQQQRTTTWSEYPVRYEDGDCYYNYYCYDYSF